MTEAAVPEARPRRRLRGPDRVAAILDAAAELFAESGFSGSTREIARRLGVTQALLYRYFPSKEALIAATLERAFADRWQDGWDTLLADESLPLVDRLTRFYVGYAQVMSRLSLRLWVQSALAGQDFALRYGFRLSLKILVPIARGLRRAAGIDPDSRSITLGERELAMILHGGIAFLMIRKFVYRMDLPDPVDDLVKLQVETWVQGAVPRVRAILAGEIEQRLAVPLIARSER
ncbi:MAG: TetR/AcrR family transcriptional regulator [Alphaproteobacteria bacterium]|nr:TetR/AcrR family transcriptional regulator [Alphaproteobacteria bacterium]